MGVPAIKTALREKLLPIFSGRVFVEQERALSGADLPCLEITFRSAEPSRDMDHFIVWRARFSLEVFARAAETDRPDQTAESLMESVQNALYQDLKIGGALSDEMAFGTVEADSDAAGEQVVRSVAMTVYCPYIAGLYPRANDDFLTAEIGFDLASPRNDPQIPAQPDGQIDARVSVQLPPLETP